MSDDGSHRIGGELGAGTCLIHDGACEVGEVPVLAEDALRELLGGIIGGND